MMIKMIDDDN